MKQTFSHSLPRARSERLVVQELPGETLVYDLEAHKAFCLNETASAIWKACDGKTTVSATARRLGAATESQVVLLGLRYLARAGLLEERPAWLSEQQGITRRDVLRTLSKSAVVLLPVIATLTVPSAAQAVSCNCAGIVTGQQCNGCVGCCGRDCRKRCLGSGPCSANNPC
jgi:hypothetical protein